MKDFMQRWGVFCALVLSVLMAACLRGCHLANTSTIQTFAHICELCGTLFMNALKMLVIPLVTSSIIGCMMGFGSRSEFKRLGFKTFLFYCASCSLATLVGFTMVTVFQPGHISPDLASKMLGQANLLPEQFLQKTHAASTTISDFFLRLIPSNIFHAATDNGQIVSLIFFSILFGFFITKLPAQLKTVQVQFWEGFQQITRNITNLVIAFSPIGVFGLVFPILLNTGLDVIRPLAAFVSTVLCGFAIYVFGILYLLMRWVGKIRPFAHYKAMMPVTLMAFSTASSAVTLPIALEKMEHAARVSQKTARFTLPLGITINMCGTALYECVVVLFIAQLYQVTQGIQLTFMDQCNVILMTLLTSIGVAGIPASGLIGITIVLQALGLPIESIGVIWLVERLLDMVRTAVNVFNDTCGTVIIARTEGEKTAYPSCA